MNKTITTRQCLVTVRRPGGDIETITHPKIEHMTAQIWAQMRAAMKAAGRGECLSYENRVETTEVKMSLEEERAELVDRLAAARERSDDAYYAATANSVLGMDYHRSAANVAGAEADLAAFDAAHPEVLAGIKATRQAAAESRMWD